MTFAGSDGSIYRSMYLGARVRCWGSRGDAGDDRRRARDSVGTGRSWDHRVGSSRRSGCKAGAVIRWRAGRWNELWSRRDRLWRHRILCGLLDRFVHLVLLQCNGLLQSHLDGRAYVEEEIVGARRNTREATMPAIAPTPAPIPMAIPGFAGTDTLEERHPGGGPVHPGGKELVSVLGWLLATEWPISAPRPAPAAGNANIPTNRPVPGSFRAYPSGLTRMMGPGMGVT